MKFLKTLWVQRAVSTYYIDTKYLTSPNIEAHAIAAIAPKSPGNSLLISTYDATPLKKNNSMEGSRSMKFTHNVYQDMTKIIGGHFIQLIYVKRVHFSSTPPRVYSLIAWQYANVRREFQIGKWLQEIVDLNKGLISYHPY